MAEAQNVLASSSKLIAEQFKGMSERKLRFCVRERVCAGMCLCVCVGFVSESDVRERERER